MNLNNLNVFHIFCLGKIQHNMLITRLLTNYYLHCKNWGVKKTPVVPGLFFHGVNIERVAQYEQLCRF